MVRAEIRHTDDALTANDAHSRLYAVGLAAAQSAATTDGDYRRIDFPKLRKRLVDEGVLRNEVLGWNDDPEPTDEELAASFAKLPAMPE